MRRAVCLLACLAACHVRERNEVHRPIVFETVVRPETAVPGAPVIAWTDDGRLRFAEPLACASEERYRLHTTIETTVRPNLATLTIGVITSGLGGVMLATGLLSRHPGSSPYTSLGGAGVVIGLPLAIGPFVNTGVEAEDQPESSPLRRDGPRVPCGDRPLAARAATIRASGLEIYGAVDASGVFAVSPFDWLDAFTTEPIQATELVADVDVGGRSRTLKLVVDHATFVAHAQRWRAHAATSTIKPLTVIPNLSVDAASAQLANGALRVALAIRNTGAGASYALRGQITAPDAPAVDGRMLYIGALEPRTGRTSHFDIAIAPAAFAAMRGAPLDFTIELRDAYGTAPTTPIKVHAAPP